MHFMTLLDSALSLFVSHPGWGMVALLTPWLPILIISGKIKNERWKKILSRLSITLIVSGMFLVFFFLALINPLLIGAGYVTTIDQLCTNGQTAFATDMLRVPDPDSEGADTFRLHGFSLDTHQPTFRRLYRYPFDLIGTRGGTVWIKRGAERWEGIAEENGAVRFTVDAKTLQIRRQELAVGVDGIAMDGRRFLLTVLAKDGRTWTYDPETLEQKDPERAGAPDDWQTCDEPLADSSFRLTSEQRAVLVDTNERPILADHPFLHGTILAIDPESKTTLIRSYTNTDEEKVILSAVSITKWPALAWEKQGEDIADRSILERPRPLLSHALLHEGTAIVFIGNSVVGLDTATGAELWRTRW